MIAEVTALPENARGLASYLDGLGPDGRPRAGNLDLMKIHQLAPTLVLIDVINSRLRTRFVGTAIVDMHGADQTGRYLDEIFSAISGAQRLLECYAEVVESGLSRWSRSAVMGARNDEMAINPFAYERFIFPLFDDNNRVRRVLTMIQRQSANGLDPEFACHAIN